MTSKTKQSPNLENYVEVHERIAAFYEKHPEGTLRCGKWYLRDVGEQTFLIYQALAYRSPHDKNPGEGWAWEPFPGQTPYTKGSELMNAETSAWGRALAALGFEVHRGIASGNEVRARTGGAENGHTPLSDKQKQFLSRLIDEKVKDAQPTVRAYAETLTGGRGGSGSKVIDALKEGEVEKVVKAAKAWAAKQPQAPADDADLPAAEDEDEGTLI